MPALFHNRRAAGQRLAERLQKYAGRLDVIVLGLARGGVPVAFEVAKELGVAMDVFLVRKLGVPGHEELAMGAIASGGVREMNESVVQMLELPPSVIDAVVEKEQRELERRERAYRDGRPEPQLAGKVVLLVDDGLATGASMRSAVTALRDQQPAKIVVAVPTAAPEVCAEFESIADEIVCAQTPRPFMGVGMWYADFSQTTDEEVRAYLARAADHLPQV